MASHTLRSKLFLARALSPFSTGTRPRVRPELHVGGDVRKRNVASWNDQLQRRTDSAMTPDGVTSNRVDMAMAEQDMRKIITEKELEIVRLRVKLEELTLEMKDTEISIRTLLKIPKEQSETESQSVIRMFHTWVSTYQENQRTDPACNDDLTRVEQFWSHMKSNERPLPHGFMDSSVLQLITLLDGVAWPFGHHIQNKLLVRPSQSTVPAKVLSRYKEVVASEVKYHYPMSQGFIIKGTPGIGKSAFLNLLLYHAASMDVDVVIHHPRHFLYVLHRNGDVTHRDLSELTKIPELANPKTLYLFDPTKKDDQPALCNAFLVMTTIPDLKHYEILRKLDTMDDSLWMYPWSVKELYLAARALNTDTEWTREHSLAIVKRFLEVGGSLRLVLENEKKYQHRLATLQDELHQLSIEKLELYRNAIKYESTSGLSEDQLPHLLFHCYPPKNSTPQFSSIGYASMMTQQILKHDFRSKSEDEQKRLDELCYRLPVDPLLLSRVPSEMHCADNHQQYPVDDGDGRYMDKAYIEKLLSLIES